MTLRMHLRLLVLGTAAFGILAATWGVGLEAHDAVSKWVTLHVVRLPMPAKGLYPGISRTPGLTAMVPVGIDANGDVLAQTGVQGAPGCCSVLIRFNLRSRRWLPGYVGDNDGVPYPSPAGGVWVLGGPFPDVLWVTREAFSANHSGGTWHMMAGQNHHGWDQINALAPDGKGNGWIAGWAISKAAARDRLFCPRAGRGLPSCTPAGWAALGFAGARAARAVAIRVPAPAPLTQVAVGRSGAVWLLDPYERCPRLGARRSCRGPELIEYQPKVRHFQTFSIPRKAWPAGVAHTGSPSMRLSVAADGTVWLSSTEFGSGLRLIEFRDGRFGSRWVNLNSLLGGPLLDRRQDLWFLRSDGAPVVVDSGNGSVTILANRRGTVLQDFHRRMWYILAPGAQTWAHR